MKHLILFLLIPLLSTSQESILAIKQNGSWTMQVNVVTVANLVKPAQSSFSYDTSFVDTALGVIVLGDWSGDIKKTDRVLYHIQGDSMYTQLDIYTQVYLITCNNTACCIDCRKGAEGKCSCVPTCDKGKCDEQTYGTTDIPGIGISNSIRNYLN